MVKDQIVDAIYRVVNSTESGAKTLIDREEIQLEEPKLEIYGDYSTNVAMRAHQKQLLWKTSTGGSAYTHKHPSTISGKDPQEMASNIVSALLLDDKLSEIVAKIEYAPPGFINFWLKKEVLTENLGEVIKSGDSYGKVSTNRGKKVMFEYGQPNTHKLPHIGHLFSYIYGETMTRLMGATGWEVRRVNYQGDVGLHVAKCLWALQKSETKMVGSLDAKVELLQKLYEEGSKAYEEDENAKKEIQEINNKIYRNDASISKIWEETRGLSLQYYKDFERRLGTKYDRYYLESEVQEKGKEKVLQNTPKIFKVSQGAHIFPGSQYGLHDRVFVTSEGNPTYEAKDLYLEELKMKEWPMDLLVITTASEQNDYFKVVFKALEETNPEMKEKLKHIGFGMVNLKSGKMSSRTGEIIGAVELVDTVVGRVGEITKKNKELKKSEIYEISEIVGLGAVKYSFLKNNPLQDTKFDIEESIAAEGNSGPYLQYTVARTTSVLAKSKSSTFDIGNLDLNKEELAVLRALIKFPEVVEAAAEAYSPNLLCNYLYNLAQNFNHFYNTCPILTNTDPSVTNFRLVLTRSVGITLKNGLTLLGIDAPERM